LWFHAKPPKALNLAVISSPSLLLNAAFGQKNFLEVQLPACITAVTSAGHRHQTISVMRD
jgi:hypothetical protein